MPLPTLKGELINIRQLRRSDAESITKHANDARVAKYLPMLPHPYSLKDAHEYINSSFRKARKKTCYYFGIELPESGEIIGGISLRNINLPDSNAETGYMLGRKFWGRGYASEALQLVLRFAFVELDLHRVYAVVQETNKASIKMLERAGFTHESVMREANRMNNRWHDVYSYGILKDEFGG